MQLALKTLVIDDEVATMLISQEMLCKSKVAYEDSDFLVNIPIDTKGVKMGITIKEKESNLYKISLRSKGSVDVCEVAKKFGGRGHINAAGCSYEGDLKEIKQKLLDTAKEHLKKDM